MCIRDRRNTVHNGWLLEDLAIHSSVLVGVAALRLPIEAILVDAVRASDLLKVLLRLAHLDLTILGVDHERCIDLMGTGGW